MLNFIKSLTNNSASSNTSEAATCSVQNTNGIQVNPNTQNPDRAWDYLKNSIKKEVLSTLPLDTPIFDNKVRFVCISDTHSRLDKMQFELPKGDVLIHAGDWSMAGSADEVKHFFDYMESLDDKFTYKCVIAGNHELTFDQNSRRLKSFVKTRNDLFEPRDYIKSCTYLEDSMVELFGIKIYGAPWQPRFGDWAFNVDRGEEILKKWNKIPENIDILITHGPPLGFGDIVRGGYHVGCCELLTTVRERVKPKYHIFGHIHEDYGTWTDGVVNYINPSTCNFRYQPVNKPVLFDIDLPDGVYKMEFSQKS